MSLQYGQLEDDGVATAARTLFDTVTPENEMKWDAIHPERDRYDFGPADRIVDFAAEHGLRVRGHALVWHTQNPAWLTEGSFSRAESIALMRAHIRRVVRRYRGKVAEWDVVNEAVTDDGSLRDTLWRRRIGPDYIALAFRFAREADPDAKLYYNDYGAEGRGAKSDALLPFLAGLKRAGVPIDGVGLQTHVDTSPIRDFRENLQRYAALGLDVALTEIDVRVSDDGDGDEAGQARTYREIVEGCLAVARCRTMVFWSLDDRHSWIPAAFPGMGRATLFDEDLEPKPAYAAVRRALRGG